MIETTPHRQENSVSSASAAPVATAVTDLKLARKPSATFRQRFRHSRRAVFGLAFLLVIAIIAISAPVLAPYPEGGQRLQDAQMGPFSTSEQGAYHLLGHRCPGP